MKQYKELIEQYNTDAAFNALVNLLRQAIEKHGFMPFEIREASFLAQWQYHQGYVEKVIRTDAEWEMLRIANEKLRSEFAAMHANMVFKMHGEFEK